MSCRPSQDGELHYSGVMPTPGMLMGEEGTAPILPTLGPLAPQPSAGQLLATRLNWLEGSSVVPQPFPKRSLCTASALLIARGLPIGRAPVLQCVFFELVFGYYAVIKKRERPPPSFTCLTMRCQHWKERAGTKMKGRCLKSEKHLKRCNEEEQGGVFSEGYCKLLQPCDESLYSDFIHIGETFAKCHR